MCHESVASQCNLLLMGWRLAVVPGDKILIPSDSLWLYTMNRCHPVRSHFALAALLSLPLLGALAPAPSLAQETIRREAPRDVLLGQMTVLAPPAIQMDGKAD